MSAPQAEASYLNAQVSIELLESFLLERSCRPSAGLRDLFFWTGLLATRFEPPKQSISTRLLLDAILSNELEGEFDRAEALALEVFRSGLVTHRETLASQLDEFRSQASSGSDGAPRLTRNIQRSLDEAATRGGQHSPDEALATVRDLLMAFPPEGSRAHKLLAGIGISVDEVHSQILARTTAVAEGIERIPNPIGAGFPSYSGVKDEFPPPPAEGSAGPAAASDKPTSAADAPLVDAVRTHMDEPALVDLLERAPFAACLAQNIREARRGGKTTAPDGKSRREDSNAKRTKGKEVAAQAREPAAEKEEGAFIVHLHGPWGSGKSSVLNFLEEALTTGDDDWLVVRFNAWRDQRRQPPWWSLISCIYAGVRDKLDRMASRKLRRRWFMWRVRADYMPWAVAGSLLALCVILLILGATTTIGPTVTAIGGLITLVGAGAFAARSLALGSQRAAQTYAELKADPFQPITDLFNSLIDAVEPKVAVFIDDLDRCDSTYVVDLLEGIQTLMRSAPVTYVVAADRKWICSSFEQKYGRFSPPIGEPGRPLGYLFLDKIFQVSAAIPQLAPDIRAAYWEGLLIQSVGSTEKRPRKKGGANRAQAEKRAKAKLAKMTTHEELDQAIRDAEKTKDPVAIQATRAEAAIRITSAEAAARNKHRLERYSRLLEPNPRSMKRLVNAYGMHQATLYLTGRPISPHALARWTILELRWPLLADFLAVRPGYVDRLAEPLEAPDRHIPERLRELFGDELLVEVIGANSDPDRLDSDSVKEILGSVQGER